MDNNIRLRMYPLDEIKRESDIVREAKAQTMMNEVPWLAASMGLVAYRLWKLHGKRNN